MKLNFFRLILSLSFLASGAVFAGPVIVGTTGGGLAELKTIYLNQNLSSFLVGCLVSANPCHVRPEELPSLQKVVQNHSAEVGSIKIVFDSNLAVPIATLPRPGSEIRISSKAVYTRDGVPQSTDHIAALILAARWSHFTATPLPALLQRSLEILGGFQDQSEHHPVGGYNSPVVFHMSRWSFQNKVQMLMLVEDATKTIDISPDVAKTLPCGGLLDWRWQNVRTSARPAGSDVSGVIAVDTTSGCQNNVPRTLVIEVLIRKDQTVPEQTRVSLRGS